MSEFFPHAALLAFFLFFQTVPVEPVPFRYADLTSMASNELVATPIGNGTALSLVQVFEDQESRRTLGALGAPPVHLSLLPRPMVRQETEPSPVRSGAPTASPSPMASPAAPTPVVTLIGKYRPPEMAVFVELVQSQFFECPSMHGPNCTKIELEREGGPEWDLPVKVVVARSGYQIEGYDYSGPQCGAFRLDYHLLPKGKDGKSYIRFQLLRQPLWPQPQSADCKLTLYEVPRRGATS